MKKIKRILACLVVIGLLYAIVSISYDVYKKRPISLCGYSISYVPTNSMDPAIPASTYVLFVETKDVKVDDIVVYQSQEGETKGLYIIHRIISKTDDGFYARGDNNLAIDEELITNDMIIGKHITNLKVLSTLLGGMSRNLIFVLVIVIFVGLFIVQILNIYFVYQKEKNSKMKADSLQKLKDEIYKEELEKLKNEERKRLEE